MTINETIEAYTALVERAVRLLNINMDERGMFGTFDDRIDASLCRLHRHADGYKLVWPKIDYGYGDDTPSIETKDAPFSFDDLNVSDAELNGMELRLAELRKRQADWRKDQVAAAEEQRERAEFQRLLAKFGRQDGRG